MPNRSLERSNQNDRLELARRLHDGPAQKLVALGYRLDALIGEQDLSTKHRRDLREIRLALMELTEDLRDELYLISKLELSALQKELPLILPEFKIELDIPQTQEFQGLENSIAILILEIARNTAKHSAATKFWARVEKRENLIHLRIGDDGRKSISVRDRSLGLKLINSQVQSLGGAIELHSGVHGNEYIIEIPKP